MAETSILITKADVIKLMADGYLWSSYYQRFIFPQEDRNFYLIENLSPDGVSVDSVLARMRYTPELEEEAEPEQEPEPEEQSPAEAIGFTPELIERLEELEAKQEQEAPAEPVNVQVVIPENAIQVQASLDVAFEETDIVERDADGFISKIIRRFRKISPDESTPIEGPTPENPSPSLRKFVRSQLGLDRG